MGNASFTVVVYLAGHSSLPPDSSRLHSSQYATALTQMKQTMPKKRTYLWQYSRPGGAVVFDFRMGREREGFKRFLGDIEGILQSDGYAHTIMSVAPRLCMQHVGPTHDARSSR
jgi:hypothetical protein